MHDYDREGAASNNAFWSAIPRYWYSLISHIGLPRYPGILVFFVSCFVSYEILNVIRHQTYSKMSMEILEGILLGLLITSVLVKAVKRLVSPEDHEELFGKLSLTLLPGILFVFAPFRYAMVCRWTEYCSFWGDRYVFLGIVLCVICGCYAWIPSFRNIVEYSAQSVGRVLGAGRYVPRWVLVWLGCLGILVWRGSGRLIQPELFAEGGMFVSDALAYGWESTLYLYGGYIHGLPRVLAILSTHLVPTVFLPLFTTLICFLIAAGVSASIVRNSYRWIIPSDGARIMAALSVCLVPGLFDVLGNLANLHYLLFLFLFLLLLKDPLDGYQKWELSAAVVIVFSSGMVAALLPVAVYRLLWIRSEFKKQAESQEVRINSSEILFALIIVIPTLALGLFIATGGESAPSQTGILPGLDDVGYLLQAASDVFLTSIFLHPFAGTVAAEEIYGLVRFPLLLSLGVVCILLFVLRLATVVDRGFSLVLIWLTVPFVLLSMIFIIRDPQLELFQVGWHWQQYKWWFRYFYFFCSAGIFLWLILIRPESLRPVNHRNILAAILFVAYVSQSNWYFTIEPYGEEHRWARTSAALEGSRREGCPQRVVVHTYPYDWGFTYKSPLKNDSCQK